MNETDQEELILLRAALASAQKFIEAQRAWEQALEDKLSQLDPNFAATMIVRRMDKES